jgi:hypothetical protein
LQQWDAGEAERLRPDSPATLERMRGRATSGMSTEEIMALTREED